MLTRKTLAIAALLFIGVAPTAFAAEDPESNIGDRYPFLQQSYNPAVAHSAGMRHMTSARISQLNVKDPESDVADRYPFLDQGYNSAVAYAASTYRAAGAQTANLNQIAEDPESKIGDRYPTLEQSVQTAGIGSTVRAARTGNFARTPSAKMRVSQSQLSSY